MTLEQIRAALPTHIMLTENVHIWQPDDEWRFDGVGWELISVNWWGKPVDIGCASSQTYSPAHSRQSGVLAEV